MLVGRNSKHIKNRFFLITDKVVQGKLSIHHMRTNEMRTDVNTTPVQGLLFGKFRRENMGVPVKYDNGAKEKNTYPMLLPKDDTDRLTISEAELINDGAGLASVRRTVAPKKRIPQGGR